MEEQDKIAELNYLRDGIYLYNWIVEPSDLGLPWVRLRSYPCISFRGEKNPCYDLDSDELRVELANNQGVGSPEDFLGTIHERVKAAGPVFWMNEQDDKLVYCDAPKKGEWF
jgi:hypothetical protein